MGDKYCVCDDRVRARLEAIHARPFDPPDPGEMAPERHITALYTMILMERLAIGVPVLADAVEEFMLRPVSEVRADMAALLLTMSPEVTEEALSKVVYDIDDAAYIADMNRRHAALNLAIDRKLLEVVRGYDLNELPPELASGIAAMKDRLEKVVAVASPAAGQAVPPKAVSMPFVCPICNAINGKVAKSMAAYGCSPTFIPGCRHCKHLADR